MPSGLSQIRPRWCRALWSWFVTSMVSDGTAQAELRRGERGQESGPAPVGSSSSSSPPPPFGLGEWWWSCWKSSQAAHHDSTANSFPSCLSVRLLTPEHPAIVFTFHGDPHLLLISTIILLATGRQGLPSPGIPVV